MEHLFTLMVSLLLVGLGAWRYEKHKAKQAHRRYEEMVLENAKPPKL